MLIMRKVVVILTFFAMLLTMPVAHASQTINIFAASSLTKTFTELSKQFERSNPKIKIRLIFSSSKTLATQIQNGAKAHIFVTASPEEMHIVTKGSNYLVNRVVLGIPKNSPIKSISDLNSGYKWIRCADEVPCGSVAKIVLKDQGIVKSPVSLEPMASSVLAKLLVGEVDAAIIYKSDAFANSMKINFIEFSNTKAASTFYQIAKLEDGFATTKVLNFLKSKETIKYLVRNGFETK